MRESLDARLEIAEQIVDSPDSSNSDKLKGLEFMARYGLGTADTTTVESFGHLHLAALQASRPATPTASTRILPESP